MWVEQRQVIIWRQETEQSFEVQKGQKDQPKQGQVEGNHKV